MSETTGGERYRWTNSATKLLVGVWSNERIQQQLRTQSRKQALWNSIARFMASKGYNVTGLQARTRIKNMTAMYDEALRTENHAKIGKFFNIFHKVLTEKKEFFQNEKTMTKSKANAIDFDELYYDADCAKVEVFEEKLDEETQDDPKFDESSRTQIETTSQRTDSVNTTAESVMLKQLVEEALVSQTRNFKQMLSEAVHSIETRIVQEREMVLAAIAEESEKRHSFESRMEKILSRHAATSVPTLTYMGAINKERDQID